MKALIALLLLFSTSAIALDKCMAGTWTAPGEGLYMEVHPGVVFFNLLTYHDQPDWLVGIGENNDGDIILDMWTGLDGETFELGTGRLVTLDEDHILLRYSLLDPWQTGCFSCPSVETEFTRLTTPIECAD